MYVCLHVNTYGVYAFIIYSTNFKFKKAIVTIRTDYDYCYKK